MCQDKDPVCVNGEAGKAGSDAWEIAGRRAVLIPAGAGMWVRTDVAFPFHFWSPRCGQV